MSLPAGWNMPTLYSCSHSQDKYLLCNSTERVILFSILFMHDPYWLQGNMQTTEVAAVNALTCFPWIARTQVFEILRIMNGSNGETFIPRFLVWSPTKISGINFQSTITVEPTIISITYATLHSNKPLYHNNLLKFQCNRNTRSSDTVAPRRPSDCSPPN